METELLYYCMRTSSHRESFLLLHKVVLLTYCKELKHDSLRNPASQSPFTPTQRTHPSSNFPLVISCTILAHFAFHLIVGL